jgi:hypothetical protein
MSPTIQSSANATRWFSPYAMTLTNLWVAHNSAVGAGTNYTYTVFTNGVATPLTLSFLGTGAIVGASNLTATVTIAKGLNCEMMISNNAASGPTTQGFGWSLEGRQ